MSVRIDIHADDFGESVHASRDILECLKDGKLNSISVLANMSCFEECVRLYREAQEEFPWQPAISVHVNLMEGSCLFRIRRTYRIWWMKKDIFRFPGRSCFCFLSSVQKQVQKQLKKEIELQIKAVTGVFSELNLQELRIDSHQHTHMIPVVAEALFEVLEEQGWKASYIRDAKEPFFVFLQKTSFIQNLSTGQFCKEYFIELLFCIIAEVGWNAGMKPMYLWGLIMSGHMDEKRIRQLLTDIEKKAEHNGRMLEILFHPGQVLREEISDEFSQEDAIVFHVSPDRSVEKAGGLCIGSGTKKARKGER